MTVTVTVGDISGNGVHSTCEPGILCVLFSDYAECGIIDSVGNHGNHKP